MFGRREAAVPLRRRLRRAGRILAVPSVIFDSGFDVAFECFELRGAG
jgi:hypothetical protein